MNMAETAVKKSSTIKRKTARTIKDIYILLLRRYGPQGWWPIISHDGTNPTKAGSINGYHVSDYSFPKNSSQRFEICAGAVLTQNTSWPSVEKALVNLEKAGLLDAKKIAETDAETIKQLIKPAGYFNQKTSYLKNFTEFFLKIDRARRVPSRADILAVKGIGNETADSILLYAFKRPEFVVDAYTKRIFSRIGMIDAKAKYDDIKAIFESNLKKKERQDAETIRIFQEYHALIVEHAKRHCGTRPRCTDCPLEKLCRKKL
jgi:endonuclease-3 related protein